MELSNNFNIHRLRYDLHTFMKFSNYEVVYLVLFIYFNSKVSVAGQSVVVSPPMALKRSALFVRNVRKIGHTKISKLLSELGAERVQINFR